MKGKKLVLVAVLGALALPTMLELACAAEIKVGGFGTFFYDRDSSFYTGGIDDKYWVERPGAHLGVIGLMDDASLRRPKLLQRKNKLLKCQICSLVCPVIGCTA